MEQHNKRLLTNYKLPNNTIDHRVPKDFNYGLNKPSLSAGWIKGYRNKVLYEFFYIPGIFMCFGAMVVAGGYSIMDFMLNNHHTNDDDRGRLQANISAIPSLKYLNHVRNADQYLGAWNHNFQCFENEPDCGKDYGLTFIKKKL